MEQLKGVLDRLGTLGEGLALEGRYSDAATVSGAVLTIRALYTQVQRAIMAPAQMEPGKLKAVPPEGPA